MGRLSFRDLEIRGYLRPDMWCDLGKTSPMLWANPPDAIVIDPLLMSYYDKNNTGNTKPPDQFPYGTPLPTASGGLPPPPAIKRVTLRAAYDPTRSQGRGRR